MTDVQYREATSQDDNTVAECFLKMWQGIGVPDDCFHPEQHKQSLDFISEARQYELKSFIAEKNGSAVGTASGHLFHGLYPDVISRNR